LGPEGAFGAGVTDDPARRFARPETGCLPGNGAPVCPRADEAALGDEGLRTDAGLTCVVELEKGNGTRMRICVRDAAGVDWGKLKEAFLGA